MPDIGDFPVQQASPRLKTLYYLALLLFLRR